MNQPRRPVPISMRVSEIGNDVPAMECPSCHLIKSRQGYDLTLDLPADYLLIRYVARHYCRRCSTPAVKIRLQGWIVPYPRSGAEPRGG